MDLYYTIRGNDVKLQRKISKQSLDKKESFAKKRGLKIPLFRKAPLLS